MVTIKERIPPAWRKCLARAPLAIGLMALIFAQSATAGLVGDLGVLSIVLSNLGHAVTFGLLAALLWWALRPVTGRALPIAVAVALLYGISDEIHQSFVAARDAALLDVGFDALGVAVATLLIRSRRSWGRERGKAPQDARAAEDAGDTQDGDAAVTAGSHR